MKVNWATRKRDKANKDARVALQEMDANKHGKRGCRQKGDPLMLSGWKRFFSGSFSNQGVSQAFKGSGSLQVRRTEDVQLR